MWWSRTRTPRCSSRRNGSPRTSTILASASSTRTSHRDTPVRTFPARLGRLGLGPFLKTDETRSGEHGAFLLGPDEFASRMSRMGIGDGRLVVAYDNRMGSYAARLWWALNTYGYRDVKLLNGGWHKWIAEGRPVTTRVPHVEPTDFPAQARRLDVRHLRSPEGGDRAAGRRHPRRAQRRRVHWTRRPWEPAARTRAGRRSPRVDRPRHRGRQAGLQARGRASSYARLSRGHSGQAGSPLLTGRDPCVARHVRAQAARLRARPQLRWLHVRMGEPRRHPARGLKDTRLRGRHPSTRSRSRGRGSVSRQAPTLGSFSAVPPMAFGRFARAGALPGFSGPSSLTLEGRDYEGCYHRGRQPTAGRRRPRRPAPTGGRGARQGGGGRDLPQRPPRDQGRDRGAAPRRRRP